MSGAIGPEEIRVRGARVHNLRDVDLDIPRDLFVVITGLSGSGKSSLAFDTIYAEGQRRYVESLSAYARHFLDQMEKPEVESIEGLSPAISIEQKTVSQNPRSTVGTVTEIYDHLRLLFARVGDPHCYRCGLPISNQSLDQMCDRVLALAEGVRVWIYAPVVRGRKGAYKKELEEYRRKGFVRVRVDGKILDLADDISLARQQRHDIDLVIDRLQVKPAARGRVAESIETALSLGAGIAKVGVGAGSDGIAEEEWLLSEKSACVDCDVSYPEIAPRLFSFNNPHGACPECAGLGHLRLFDPERIVSDPSLTLAEGAIEPWRKGKHARYFKRVVAAVADHVGISMDAPWSELPAAARRLLLHGSGKKTIPLPLPGRRKGSVERHFDGVIGELERRAAERDSDPLDRLRVSAPCPGCEGARLRVEARHIKLAGQSIDEVSALSIAALGRFVDELALEPLQREIADRILVEIRERIRFLADVGLEYLSLDRPSGTLSGGEGQRIRLATQIGASLMGVLYILDEPSIGLHPRDHQRLLESLIQLRDMGNSILVVEHDQATIEAADYVIDMGPGAGIHGGQIVAAGSPDEIARNDSSVTGAYLSGARVIDVPARRSPDPERWLRIRDCRGHNLKGVTLEIPLGLLTVVTGVSGSGKSTLVNDTLHRALAAELHGALEPPEPHASLEGADQLDKVIDVSQAPIGRTPRSNPATYSGAFDGIRNLFTQVPEARVRGYSSGRFSFNVKGGRCEACKGDGVLRVEMHFLPDLFVPCEICRGRRYNRETLEVLYKGHSIADVLEMSVEEALPLFQNMGPVQRPLQALHDVGLDYLHLGQAATTLSGGEAQRIKLARELARKSTGRTLYLLDEPTTGLHFADVEKLLEVLRALVEKGNTVVVIEHHLDVVKSADHVVDLGPEGGEAGGELVARGTPEEVAAVEASHTGRALRPLIAAAGAPA